MSKKNTCSNFNPIVVRNVRYRYVPVQQTIESEELGTYISYGISARTVEEEIFRISDVSTDFEKVRRLADLCTERELAPEHLGDVIEDFLAMSEEETVFL